jgi:hypothetical protein
VLTQKGDPAAVHGATVRLVLRALVEAAEPAEIPPGRVEKEHIDLMVSDAGLLLFPELIHRAAAQDAQPVEFGGVIEPHGDIDILGFVNETSSARARGLHSGGRGDRPKKRDSAYGRNARERGGNILSRYAEISVPNQRVAVIVIQPTLIPAALGCSVHGSLSCSVKGSDLPAGVNKSGGVSYARGLV